MLELDIKEFQPYLFIVGGVVFILIALFKKTSKSNLKLSGIRAEGIVFSLERKADNGNSINDNANVKDKVTVRFITKDKEWITGDIQQEFAAFYTGQYKLGQSLDVYYNPTNPSEFFINTKQSETLSRATFAVAGLVFSLIGCYQLLMN